MSLTLQTLLDSALGGGTTKVASAADASNVPAVDDLDALFNGTTPTVLPPLYAKTASAAAPPAASQVVAAAANLEKTAARALATDAQHYADAIDLAAEIMDKLAADTFAASSSHGLDVAPRTPPQPSRGTPNEGSPHGTQPGGLPNQMPNDESKTIATKTAGDALVRAKLAQAEALRAVGNDALADALVASTKVAQDPSSPQPVIHGSKTSPMMATDAGVPQPGISMSNEAAASLTRAQARDASTREAGAMIGVTPAKDPAVAAALGTDEGLKTSSARFSIEDAVKSAAALTPASVLHGAEGITPALLHALGGGAVGGAFGSATGAGAAALTGGDVRDGAVHGGLAGVAGGALSGGAGKLLAQHGIPSGPPMRGAAVNGAVTGTLSGLLSRKSSPEEIEAALMAEAAAPPAGH
jgi:hypothetical protein